MTYSIVARDAETGQLGVAVQTCRFAVGSVVPWVRPGVGVVASQAIVRGFVAKGLVTLPEGMDLDTVLG